MILLGIAALIYAIGFFISKIKTNTILAIGPSANITPEGLKKGMKEKVLFVNDVNAIREIEL